MNWTTCFINWCKKGRKDMVYETETLKHIEEALIDIEGRKRELDNLDDILSSLDDTPRKLK